MSCNSKMQFFKKLIREDYGISLFFKSFIDLNNFKLQWFIIISAYEIAYWEIFSCMMNFMI